MEVGVAIDWMEDGPAKVIRIKQVCVYVCVRVYIWNYHLS